MLDTVIELTQQQAVKRMAQAAEEYAAANNQLGYVLSEVDRVRIRRQMDVLEAEMRDLALRMRQPWHNHLARIDYSALPGPSNASTPACSLRAALPC